MVALLALGAALELRVCETRETGDTEAGGEAVAPVGIAAAAVDAVAAAVGGGPGVGGRRACSGGRGETGIGRQTAACLGVDALGVEAEAAAAVATESGRSIDSGTASSETMLADRSA
jgi:hypothetical protein